MIKKLCYRLYGQKGNDYEEVRTEADSQIACAYYKLEEHDEISEEEKDEIIEYINKYGQAMATRIGEAYYTL